MDKDLANVLRAAIIKSGQSARALERVTGVPQPTITRFLNGADMKLSTTSKIAAYLGLQLKGAATIVNGRGCKQLKKRR